MNNSFDWGLVASFVAVLERGSLLGAARQLGISQPTVGRHIAELESQLGTVLFERTGRGLTPTAMAHQLAEPARAMQRCALALSHQASGEQTDLAGTVRLSASQPVACYLLPPLLARMRQALPAIQIELVASNAVSNLLQREADIALRMVQPEQSSLIAKRVGQVTVSACASADYLARCGTPERPEDLLAHELIGFDRAGDILRGFALMGLPTAREQFALRTDDMLAYWQAVRAGLGIGFVADYLLASDPGVQRVLPGLPLPALPIWLTVHREVRASARIRAVYDFLSQAIAPALASGHKSSTMADSSQE